LHRAWPLGRLKRSGRRDAGRVSRWHRAVLIADEG
jgi:hypothetical protein